MKSVQYSLVSILAIVTFATLPVSSQAAVEDGTRLSPDFVAPLMNWVSNATNTTVPALPRVIASGDRLKNALGLEGVRRARSMAAYTPGQVVLNHVIWDQESTRSVSYLVHELVHHAQLFNGKKYMCPNAMEYEAYSLQNEWLRQHGESPIVNARFIAEMAACPAGSSMMASATHTHHDEEADDDAQTQVAAAAPVAQPAPQAEPTIVAAVETAAPVAEVATTTVIAEAAVIAENSCKVGATDNVTVTWVMDRHVIVEEAVQEPINLQAEIATADTMDDAAAI